MENIGAEVGQKMRSAIKAKLLELSCYVDDELPDYIMVMVANKRSKTQMTEDLNLFLSTKTTTFVNWLHIVLKKLKEVTVTNSEIYKTVTKWKAVDNLDDKVKKEKRYKKANDTFKQENEKTSLTDDLPITATHLNEKRRIAMIKEENVAEPMLFIENASTTQELEKIEKKIRTVKSRLGDLVENEDTDLKRKDDVIGSPTREPATLKYRTVELQEDGVISKNVSEYSPMYERTVEYPYNEENVSISLESEVTGINLRKRKHSPIIFENDTNKKRNSVLDRLGERAINSTNTIRLSEFRKEEEQFLGYFLHRDCAERDDKNITHSSQLEEVKRDGSRSPNTRKTHTKKWENVKSNKFESRRLDNINDLNKLGVMSKIRIPSKELQNEFHAVNNREVKSVIQVKPKVISITASQPSKNLLLKAVAEAQKSIIEASKTRMNRLEYSTIESGLISESKSTESKSILKLSESDKSKIRDISFSNISHHPEDDHNVSEAYIPSPMQKTSKSAPNYIPSLKGLKKEEANTTPEKQFIVTLDIHANLSESRNSTEGTLRTRNSAEIRLQRRKSHSPIIFDKSTTKAKSKTNIPENLATIRPPLSIKIKERCKYWPSCRQGDKCEFTHPTSNCETFPNCNFGDKCLYFHPNCKFGNSCTKRNCSFSHVIMPTSIGSTVLTHTSKKAISTQQKSCKYFPNCVNIGCPFYHPIPCKYGNYCKRPIDCIFSHPVVLNKPNLTWHSK